MRKGIETSEAVLFVAPPDLNQLAPPKFFVFRRLVWMWPAFERPETLRPLALRAGTAIASMVIDKKIQSEQSFGAKQVSAMNLVFSTGEPNFGYDALPTKDAAKKAVDRLEAIVGQLASQLGIEPVINGALTQELLASPPEDGYTARVITPDDLPPLVDEQFFPEDYA